MIIYNTLYSNLTLKFKIYQLLNILNLIKNNIKGNDFNGMAVEIRELNMVKNYVSFFVIVYKIL